MDMNKLDKFSVKKPKINLDISTWPRKIKKVLKEYRRVIIVTNKPSIEEISKISKVAGIGILLIGLIGFAIQMAFQLLVSGV